MYNTSNPAELYPNTTWELLPTDKHLKTTTGTPLSTGGSNSFTIQKANLPSVKLQVESFSLTRGTMNITGGFNAPELTDGGNTAIGAFIAGGMSAQSTPDAHRDGSQTGFTFDASKSWVGNTSSANPYTTNMGSGTAITINPTYITVRTWKRLS